MSAMERAEALIERGQTEAYRAAELADILGCRIGQVSGYPVGGLSWARTAIRYAMRYDLPIPASALAEVTR